MIKLITKQLEELNDEEIEKLSKITFSFLSNLDNLLKRTQVKENTTCTCGNQLEPKEFYYGTCLKCSKKLE